MLGHGYLAEMMLTSSTADRFAGLLKSLKDAYGWQELCALPQTDFITLLRRSARSHDDKAVVEAVIPLIHHGLLPLLSTRAGNREPQIRRISSVLRLPPQDLQNLVRSLDRTIRLTNSEREPEQVQTSDAGSKQIAISRSKLRAVVVGASVLLLAAGVGLTLQVGRYRQELARQQQATKSQKAEIDAMKKKLSSSTSSIPSPNGSAPEPPVFEPLQRPSLPAGSEATSAVPSQSSQESSRESPRPSPATPSQLRWSGCDEAPDTSSRSGTWWPVVGVSESLDAVRRHCRPDAFLNRDGNVQVASYRDRDAALNFASQLTADSRHPYRFYVGEPTTLD